MQEGLFPLMEYQYDRMDGIGLKMIVKCSLCLKLTYQRPRSFCE